LKSQGENSLNNFQLNETQAQELKIAIEKINQQKLSDEERALESSYAYAQYKQIDTAIEELEKVRNAGSDNPEVFLVLGDLFAKKKSVEPAKDRYQKALELASNSNDSQAIAVSIVAKTQLASFLLQEASSQFKQLQQQRTNSTLNEMLDNLFSQDAEAHLDNLDSLIAAVYGCPRDCRAGSIHERAGLQCIRC
jgi:lipopolysaccharide biosynthesis regulator YciM